MEKIRINHVRRGQRNFKLIELRPNRLYIHHGTQSDSVLVAYAISLSKIPHRWGVRELTSSEIEQLAQEQANLSIGEGI